MTQRARISRVWDETSEIRCFELIPHGEMTSFAAPKPGAHIDVHVKDGMIRQYSLFNGPEDVNRYLIGVKKELQSRGGSHGMHALLDSTTLTIDGPRNNFDLVEDDGRCVLMAGGIGITPLLSMARHLSAWKRPYELHLFVRSAELAPFRSLLAEIGNTDIHVGLESPRREEVVTSLLRGRGADAHVYVCGPKPFMDLVVGTAESEGWQQDKVHLEYFSAELPVALAGDTAIEVVLARSGKCIVVPPDQTIAEAMLAQGIDIMTSCEQGVCGTCLTNVLEGEPDHRDVYLSPGEKSGGRLIMPCVSRCKGPRMVLDL